jgi:hypothetical protein
VPLGKPPKYPGFKNRPLGPDIEDRIRELSAPKQGRSGKEEMQILSKILVTLLCSCRSAAATQELKKIIRHFKEAASEAGDEFGDDLGVRSSASRDRFCETPVSAKKLFHPQILDKVPPKKNVHKLSEYYGQKYSILRYFRAMYGNDHKP